MKPAHFFAIVELRTKVVSISTFTIALLYSISRGGTVPWHLALLTLTAALAVDMGTTAFNTYFDFLKAVDHRQENKEKDKILIHENIPAAYAFLIAAGCYGVAVILGGIITLLTSWEVALSGAFCMAVGFLYTGGPLPISRTPLGEVFAGGFLGSAFFNITVYILTGNITIAAFLVSLPPSLMIAAILAVNNACDIEGDSRAGRKTLAVLLGPRRAPWVVLIYIGAAIMVHARLGTARLLPWYSLISLGMAAVPIIMELLHMYRRGFSHGTKGESMKSISRIFLWYSLAYALAFTLPLAAGLPGQ